MDFNKGDWIVWYGDVCKVLENTHGKANFETDRWNGETPYTYIYKHDADRNMWGAPILRLAKPDEIQKEINRRGKTGLAYKGQNI